MSPTVAAARALAAYLKASTRYNWIGKLEEISVYLPSDLREVDGTYNVAIIPKPNMPAPVMGIMKWSFACADHPYQLCRPGHISLIVHFSGTEDELTYNRPMGTSADANMSAGIRISGLPTPPFLSASCECMYDQHAHSYTRQDERHTYAVVDPVGDETTVECG